MDIEFADWYREIDITPSGELLTKRWEAIEKLAPTLTPESATDAARVLYALTPKDSQFLTRFRAAFQAADPAFSSKGNDREIQVLAGATLVQIFTPPSLAGDVAALATRCADAQGFRRGAVPGFAIRRAERYLRERCAALRQEQPAPGMALPATLKTDVAPVRAEAPPDAAAQVKALKAVADALDAFAIATAQRVDHVTRAHRFRREEADILWWAFSGYSRDLDQPFETFPLAARALIAPKELVDLVQILPGPVSAIAVLDRVIFGPSGVGRNAALTLRQAIEQVPRQWLSVWTPNLTGITRHGDLCPTLMAAQRAAESGGGEGWITPVERVTNMPTTASLAPLQLAAQAYDEHRFLRLLPEK